MFCELTKCCEVILAHKIVLKLSYDRLWIPPLSQLNVTKSMVWIRQINSSLHSRVQHLKHSCFIILLLSVSHIYISLYLDLRLAIHFHWTFIVFQTKKHSVILN